MNVGCLAHGHQPRAKVHALRDGCRTLEEVAFNGPLRRRSPRIVLGVDVTAGLTQQPARPPFAIHGGVVQRRLVVGDPNVEVRPPQCQELDFVVAAIERRDGERSVTQWRDPDVTITLEIHVAAGNAQNTHTPVNFRPVRLAVKQKLDSHDITSFTVDSASSTCRGHGECSVACTSDVIDSSPSLGQLHYLHQVCRYTSSQPTQPICTHLLKLKQVDRNVHLLVQGHLALSPISSIEQLTLQRCCVSNDTKLALRTVATVRTMNSGFELHRHTSCSSTA